MPSEGARDGPRPVRHFRPPPARPAADTVLTLYDACQVTTRATVLAQLAARRWQAPVDGVIVLHNAALTPGERELVALAAAPPGAVLGGLTAAAHDGLDGFADDRTTIVVPGSSRTPHPLVDVRVHWSRELSDLDVNSRQTPPRTRLARSLLDAASERGTAGRARALLIAGAQQRLTTAARLDASLQRRGRCRNRAVIRETIGDIRGGVESLPEKEYDQLCRREGFPPPTAQRLLQRADGRAYLDRSWDAWGVAVEIHGIPHLGVRRWDADCIRQNEIAIEGPRLLVFTSYAVRHESAVVAAQTRRLLRRGGWTG